MSLVSPSPAKPLIPGVAALERALSPFAEPLVRVAAGLMLMPHGAQKLFGWFGGYGVDATGQFFAAKLGLPAVVRAARRPDRSLRRPGARRSASSPAPPRRWCSALMAVAIIWVHLPIGYFWMTGGFEYPLMWGLVALAFVFRGGGRYSVDALIGREI